MTGDIHSETYLKSIFNTFYMAAWKQLAHEQVDFDDFLGMMKNLKGDIAYELQTATREDRLTKEFMITTKLQLPPESKRLYFNTNIM